MGNKLKIFLSYHKDTPIYKSDIFQPIKVGGGLLKDAVSDDEGDNISYLNPYYCELTGQYWVLKNYIKNCEEEYIGFAHYRRLPDLTNISDDDIPAIYGMKYSDSLSFFNKLNTIELCYNKYDVIVPCTCYMYANTVNPILRSVEQNYNVYDHFKTEHKNNLLDILKTVIPNEYKSSLERCYKSEKSLFYNIYIMKKDLMIEYLEWLFDILAKLGDIIGGWEQDCYLRMAGFVSESLIDIWLNYKSNLKIGHVPIYMIDFEADYIEKINELSANGEYNKSLELLEKLLKITSDKFNVSLAMLNLSIQTNNYELQREYLSRVKEYAKTGDDFYTLASTLVSNKFDTDEIISIYEKAIELNPDEKIYVKDYLRYAESIHDLERTKRVWNLLSIHTLTSEEYTKLQHFNKIYAMVSNQT